MIARRRCCCDVESSSFSSLQSSASSSQSASGESGSSQSGTSSSSESPGPCSKPFCSGPAARYWRVDLDLHNSFCGFEETCRENSGTYYFDLHPDCSDTVLMAGTNFRCSLGLAWFQSISLAIVSTGIYANRMVLTVRIDTVHVGSDFYRWKSDLGPKNCLSAISLLAEHSHDVGCGFPLTISAEPTSF